MPSNRPRDDGGIDLSLWGISDMELLALVDDMADEDGWALTTEIRLQLGDQPDKSHRSGMGTRLAWMRRYGWLEATGTGSQKDPKRWRLTAIGHALLDNPKLSSAFERSLEKLNPAQRLVLTRQVGEGAGSSTSEIRDALRRQWQRSLRGQR
jgi:hypothetical protein